MTATDRVPKMHGSRHPKGACSYTGPDDADYCGDSPLVHVLVEDSGADEMTSMAACEGHAGIAAGIAHRTGLLWTTHPYTDDCAVYPATVHMGGCRAKDPS